jgi:nucleoside-diphosphate-sugar epimerase
MNLIMDEINMKYFHPRQTEEERHEYPITDQSTMHAIEWYEVERKLVAESLQKRRTARIDRTKPPIHDTSIIEELRRTNRYASRVDNEENTNVEEVGHHQNDEGKHKLNQAKSDHCGYHAKDAFKSNPSFYPLKHMINNDSVIVITGILGRIGFHLALKLASCNVKVIIAIDGMYPNDPPYRLRQLQQLAHLYAKVPNLNKPFIMTYEGINPKVTYHSSFQKMMNDLNGELDFGVFQPTHIVHLSNAEMNNSESHDTDGIFHLRQSLIGLEQLLASFSQVKSDLQFILASSTAVVHGDDEEYIISDDVVSKKKIFQATKEMEETMLKLFAKTYSRTVLILRLPTVYGPWGKLGDSDYDMVSVATTHWGRKGMTKQILDDNMYLLHVDGMYAYFSL